MANQYGNLGKLYITRGGYGNAGTMYEKALELFVELYSPSEKTVRQELQNLYNNK